MAKISSFQLKIGARSSPDIAKACPMCTGKQAGVTICSIFSGKPGEAGRLSTGKEHQVVATSCRAKGDLACTGEVRKAVKKE